MRFNLAALFLLITCCCLLAGSLYLPPIFLTNWRLVNITTGKIYTAWPLEAAWRVAIIAFTFFVVLRLMRSRYFRQP
jgi:membrane protein implicated in regulation of membrane protease activity